MVKAIVLFLCCGLCVGASAQNVFRLAPPLLQYQSVFFKKSMEVYMRFAQPGTSIHYTVTGAEPTEDDAVYTTPLTVTTGLSTIKAKAFGGGFLPSSVVSATFINDGLPVIATSQSTPHAKYPGNGNRALFDNAGGVPNTGSPYWLGYQRDTVSVTIYLQRKQPVKSVLLNLLQDHNARVYLPQQVSLYYFDEKTNKFNVCFSNSFEATEVLPGSEAINLVLPINKIIKAGTLKVVMVPVQSLPKKHPGKGNPGWLFIDEIKVY